MKLGTKSLLYGAHAVWWHPFWVAVAWARLFGFPRDPRLWVAFFVHDLGYWGCPNMDGPEGKRHPYLGARLMANWFGAAWGTFTLAHSRSTAQEAGVEESALCAADKLATAIEPSWFYLLRVRLTGEAEEYRQQVNEHFKGDYSLEEWYDKLVEHFSKEARRLAIAARHRRVRLGRPLYPR